MKKIIAFIICTFLITTTGLSVAKIDENGKSINNRVIDTTSGIIDSDTKIDIDNSNHIKNQINYPGSSDEEWYQPW